MTPIPLIQGITLTASTAIYYTVPATDAKIKSIRLTSIRLVNTDSVARTVTLYICPQSQSPGVSNTRLASISIAAAGAEDSSAFFQCDDVMLQGTTIRALASAAGVVSLSANGMTYP